MKNFLSVTLITCCAFIFKFGNVDADGIVNRKSEVDSLLTRLSQAKEDTNKVNLYIKLIFVCNEFDGAAALKFEQPALQLAEKIHWQLGIARIKMQVGRIHWRNGNFELALKNHFEALALLQEEGDDENISSTLVYIGQDYADGGNYPEALKYFNKAKIIIKKTNNKAQLANLYLVVGWVYGCMGNTYELTKTNYEALKLFEELGDNYGIAIANSNIGDENASLGNDSLALKFYEMSIEAFREVKDQINLGYTYNSIGKVNLRLRNYSEALKNHLTALKIGKDINNQELIASSYGAMGDVYNLQGNYKEALNKFLLAAEAFRSVSRKQELANIYSNIGICYTRFKQYNLAKKSLEEAFQISKALDSKVPLVNYYQAAEFLDSALGNWKDAYFHYKNYIINRDSIYGQENIKKIVQAQMNYNMEKQDAIEKAEQEKKDIRQRTIRNSITATLAGVLVFLVVVYRQRNKIEKEKKRSENLLLNILPEEVAEELKLKGRADAKQIEHATVLFTDFKGFTEVSEKLSPSELVAEIHECFSAFDHIMKRHGVEKIKTIGDAYMAAGGLPVANKTHATDVISAALEIRDFMKARQLAISLQEGRAEVFEVRIGVHTGPVIAGIVGVKKFSYDIWGDTVNTASRMESSGEVGKVNISESTFELVKNKFNCTPRGKISVKGKGEIMMYFVNHDSDSTT